jgi:hypothetical protein
MPRGPSPFQDWAAFGLTAFGAALAPWQDKLTSAELIPEWYQPRTSIIASVAGVLVCYCIFYVLTRTSRRRLIRLCVISLVLFILTVVGCFTLNASVDQVWFPEGFALVLLRVGWQLLFVLVFIFFSLAVASAMRLRKRE